MASREGWRCFSSEFKAKVALRDVETVANIASKHGFHPNQTREWRRRAKAGISALFGADADVVAKRDATIKDLHAKGVPTAP